jgi:hypothetical protein
MMAGFKPCRFASPSVFPAVLLCVASWFSSPLQAQPLPNDSKAPDIRFQDLLGRESSLSKLGWDARKLVIFSPAPTHPTYQTQKEELEKELGGLLRRDLVIISTCETKAGSGFGAAVTEAEALAAHKTYGVSKDEFRIFLIGKDGEIKWQSTEVIKVGDLYEIIDAMPMGAREAAERKK